MGQQEMLEAFLAAVINKVCDGEIEVDVDDLIAVEGKVFAVNDVENGFVLSVMDGEEP